jgi:DNA-binding MltR family transcriptional regulator
MSRQTKFDDPAANALYQSFVRTVLETVDQRQFDIKDMEDLFARLRNESETAQVLIFSAYLEDKIRDLFQSHLVDLGKERDRERVFGSQGPLATFSSRILMLRHLGWISKRSADDLDNWRRIRNEFAHAAYRVSFDDQRINALWNNIKTNPDQVLQALSTQADVEVLEMSELAPDHQRLVKLALLAVDVFHQLLVLPVAKSWSIAPADVMMIRWDDMPSPVKHVWEIGAQALVRVADSANGSRGEE